MIALRQFKAILDEFDFLPGRGNATLGLLLEGVQHIDAGSKPNCIDRPVRIRLMLGQDLQDGSATKSL